MERSFWEEVRTGRYKGEAALLKKALGGRARRILSARPPAGLKSVVVKQLSTTKSVEALRRVARYIARLDVDYTSKETREATKARDRAEAVAQEPSPPRVFDEHGNDIGRERVLDTLAGWNLIADRDNLTAVGEAVLHGPDGGWRAVRSLEAIERQGDMRRRKIDEERRRKQPVRQEEDEDGKKRKPRKVEAFEEIQGRHLILSVEVPWGMRAAFEEVARETVRRTFGAWGYPAFVAVHAEHGKEMHAHILVGTTRVEDDAVASADMRPRGNRGAERFVFDRDGIVADGLRHALAEVAGELGFTNLDASRREDRGDLVERALAGEEEIRPRPPRQEFDEELRPDDRLRPGGKRMRPEEMWASDLDSLPPIVRRVVRRAPVFTIEHVDAFVKRLEQLEKARGARLREKAETDRITTPLFAPKFPKPSTDRDPAARNAPSNLLRRLAERIRGPAAGEAGQDEEVVNEIHRMVRDRRVFETPRGDDRSAPAIAAWQAMRREDVAFADWALVNAPWLFGEVTEEALVLPGDETFDTAIRSLTDEDREQGTVVRRRQLEEKSPAVLADLYRTAVEAAGAAVSATPGAWGQERLARRAQRVVVYSYLTLADEIDAAFTGQSPEDLEMRENAVRIRELAEDVRNRTPLPTPSAASDRVTREPERDRDRQQPAPRPGRPRDDRTR